MDLVLGVKKLPCEGETVRGLSKAETPGGKGANQAYACGRQGRAVTFLSAVGKDAYGTALLKSLQGAGVEWGHIRQCDTPTGMAVITVSQQGANSIVVLSGANAACDTDYIAAQARLFSQCDILLTQLETPKEGVYKAVELAASHQKCIILNPAPVEAPIPKELLQKISYITPNEVELRTLTGCPTGSLSQVKTAAAVLLSQGVKNVLVTLGEKGALLVNSCGATLYPTYPVKAVDTVAAGDTFNGAFAAALSRGESVTPAIRYANAAAAISVSRRGAQASVPSRQEVEALLFSAGNREEQAV